MKPTILVLAEFYLPSYLAGGPVRSLAGIVDVLGDDFNFKIITTDRDLRAQHSHEGIHPDRWVQVGKASAFYCSPDRLGVRNFVSLLRATSCDLIYLNSFFSPRFAILPLMARGFGLWDRRSILIAPRGELSPGALELKRVRKAAFVAAARFTAAYRHVHWHATADAERENIVRKMGAKPTSVSVASNIALSEGKIEHRIRVSSESLRVCFLSRISRKKNLDLALKAMSHVTVPVVFTVYGPIEDETYWDGCLQLSRELPPNVTFRYEGSVPHERVQSELAKHDLFFLPTRGENFGHALVEAWGAGLPILVSDQTPWRNLESIGVGWDVSLLGDSATRFAQIIDHVAGWSDDELVSARSRAAAYASAIASDADLLNVYREMFMGAIDSSTRG